MIGGGDGSGEDNEILVRVFNNGIVEVSAERLEMSWMEGMRLAAVLIRASDDAARTCGASDETINSVRDGILAEVFGSNEKE